MFAAALARSPAMVVELWRLARDTREAARRLAQALIGLLEGGLPDIAPGLPGEDPA